MATNNSINKTTDRLNITPTGTGSGETGEIRFQELTANGSNYVMLQAPDLLAASRVVTLPDTDISTFVVQRVSVVDGALATGTTTFAATDAIPQNTSGDEYMTLAITPKSASNILVIEVCLMIGPGATGTLNAGLWQDSTADALAATGIKIDSTGINSMYFQHVMTAGTTSATTFKVRAGLSAAGTTSFNGNGGVRRYGGVAASSTIITEYSA